MDSTSIYGAYEPALEAVMQDLIGRIRAYSSDTKKKTGEAAYEHLIYRLKGEASMREKCDRKGLPQTAQSALHHIYDRHRHPHLLLPKATGLSQEQLAERAGISPGFLSQVEAPGMAVGISLSTLFLIAEALEIPPYKLLQFDD